MQWLTVQRHECSTRPVIFSETKDTQDFREIKRNVSSLSSSLVLICIHFHLSCLHAPLCSVNVNQTQQSRTVNQILPNLPRSTFPRAFYYCMYRRKSNLYSTVGFQSFHTGCSFLPPSFSIFPGKDSGFCKGFLPTCTPVPACQCFTVAGRSNTLISNETSRQLSHNILYRHSLSSRRKFHWLWWSYHIKCFFFNVLVFDQIPVKLTFP